ncbi:hypothetical protein llap_306 [Limosa lapponica baueri]|uniref:Uncharacterized protein n=1 Tax=Limosa lapponica baueri TaxID=1758121 RepID=A0A2I0UTQ6_LIMLA|nr:hypothetical protein llap_306 [Limosa lapponica baueri]
MFESCAPEVLLCLWYGPNRCFPASLPCTFPQALLSPPSSALAGSRGAVACTRSARRPLQDLTVLPAAESRGGRWPEMPPGRFRGAGKGGEPPG